MNLFQVLLSKMRDALTKEKHSKLKINWPLGKYRNTFINLPICLSLLSFLFSYCWPIPTIILNGLPHFFLVYVSVIFLVELLSSFRVNVIQGPCKYAVPIPVSFWVMNDTFSQSTHGPNMYVQKTFTKGRSYLVQFGNTERRPTRNVLWTFRWGTS